MKHESLEDTQSLYSLLSGGTQQPYRTGGTGLGDAQSLYSSFGRASATQPTSCGVGEDTLSVGSLDMHMQVNCD